MKGKNIGERSKEVKDKISKSLFGRKFSEERKQKLRGRKLSKQQLERRKTIPKKECEYCHKKIAPHVFSRCHGDKCNYKN